jgi:hypothetical protein
MAAKIKKWLSIVAMVAIATCMAATCLYFVWAKEFIAIDRCLDAGGVYEKDWETCNKSMSDMPKTTFTGPVYAGTLNGKKVRLQLRDDYLGYRMIENGLRTVGDLNTERGFGSDNDSVVYVLNPTGYDEPRQTRFLRTQINGVEELQPIAPGDKLQKDSPLRAQATTTP